MYRISYVSDSNFLKMLNGLFANIKNSITGSDPINLKTCGIDANNDNKINKLKFMNRESYLFNGRIYERCRENFNLIERSILYKPFGWINKEQN